MRTDAVAREHQSHALWARGSCGSRNPTKLRARLGMSGMSETLDE